MGMRGKTSGEVVLGRDGIGTAICFGVERVEGVTGDTWVTSG